MKLLLPLEAIIEPQHIVSEISNFINITESLAEINEQIKTVDKDDEYISNLIQFFESFREYIRNKEYDEEVKVVLKPNEGVDDPFPVFSLLINASILMFIKTHLPKILANNINEIEIFISDRIKTDFNNNSKYSFTELTNSINWAMKSIMSYVLNVSYPSRILLVILQIIPKIIGIFERFQSIVNIDSLTDDEIFERLLDKETLCMLNFNLDPALFERYDFTNFELDQLVKIRFSVIDSADIAKGNKNNVVTGEDVYYFIEHIDDLPGEIFHRKNFTGLSHNSEYYYKREYFEINNKLKAIVNLMEEVSYPNMEYNIDFFSALDPKLAGIIASLINNKEKYICVVCKDDYIVQKIRTYFSVIFNNEFSKKSAVEIISSGPLGNNYLMINGVDELSSEKFRKLWTKIKHRTLANGFVIFTANKIPVNIDDPADFASHEWRYDSKLIDKNFSKIFHSIISEAPKNKVMLTRTVIEHIKSNRYRQLFPPDKINLKCLHDAIFSKASSMNFDYNSARSWYSIINEYQERLESLQAEENTEAKRLVKFIYDGNRWLIDGITDEIITETKFKGVLYLALALLNYQECHKGIEYQHLAIISDYYEEQIKPHLKESASKSKKSPQNHESRSIRYGDRISNALKGKDSENLDDRLKEFIEEHIKCENNHVNYYERNGIMYHYAVNEELKMDNRLFKNNYLDILRKKK